MRDYGSKHVAENDILGPWHQIALAHFDFSGLKVLDVGAGTGRFLERIAGVAAEVHGIDPNPLNCRAMASLGIASTTGYLSADCPLSPDVITCFEVIEHVYDPHPIVAAARAILKPGGVFIVSTPNAFNAMRAVKFAIHQRHHDPLMDPVAYGENAEHVRGYSFSMARKLLEMHAFRNIKYLGQVPLSRYFARNIVLAAEA